MHSRLSDYNLDQVYKLGHSQSRGSVVYNGRHRDLQNICALRVYEKADKPRPNYRQWEKTQIFQEQNNSVVEKMQYYPKDFDSLLGDPEVSKKKQYQIMQIVSFQLKKHHENKQVHGNIHPQNILFDQALEKAHFFDSLKGGNLNSHYSSPENQLFGGFQDPVVDVWALGVLFLELLSQKLVIQGDNKLEGNPYELLLFPEQSWFQKTLENVKDGELKQLILRMLDRNYKQRITMPRVVQILKKIIQRQRFSFYQQYETFPLRFCLITQEKQNIKPRNTTTQQWNSQKTVKLQWPNIQNAFGKSNFRFCYDIAKEELRIALLHPSSSNVLLQVNYYEEDLTVQMRQKFSLKYLALLLYHTPAERFQFLMNGELKVNVSVSAIQYMIFDASN